MEQEDCRIEQQVPEITNDEVCRAVKGMKNGKAAGPGGLQIELVKTAPTAVHEVLARLFNKCLLGEDIPQDWKKAHITSIYIYINIYIYICIYKKGGGNAKTIAVSA